MISNTVHHTHIYDGCIQWIHVQVTINNNVSEMDDKGQTTSQSQSQWDGNPNRRNHAQKTVNE